MKALIALIYLSSCEEMPDTRRGEKQQSSYTIPDCTSEALSPGNVNNLINYEKVTLNFDLRPRF